MNLEYAIVSKLDEVNRLASEGWEVFETHPVTTPKGTYIKFVMVRTKA